MEAFADWLASAELGQYLLCREQAYFDRVVADAFGFRAVQVGLTEYDFLACNRIPWHGYAGAEASADVVCDAAFLPFDSRSLDLLVMPHALDFTSQPHQVLREAERVLMPEGRLVLTGFNPISLWGSCRVLHGRRNTPWSGNFFSPARIRDWMALLQLEATATAFMAYSPPFNRGDWLSRWQFMDSLGERGWSLAAGVYGIEAVKRQRGMRLLMPAWKPAKAGSGLIVAGGNERHPVKQSVQDEIPHG